ncbi:MAG: hypothetical protein A3F68_11905 [Acidobacteria bacterium RIFCSPLOWO2_12_FULL_54_10]|nr:MAG: hypothetical protein A3F68_11905 [Acidobacteria bacterium RIFCSPLOWO2_12_FULL_54_10]
MEDFVPDSAAFEWDRGNQAKNLKHGLTLEDIESVFWQPYVFAGRIADPAHSEWRGLILGQSAQGRRVALIFTRRGERVRVISCRSMRPAERRLYEITTAQE